MKRDMDLIRDLLFYLENQTAAAAGKPDQISIKGHTAREIEYHCLLLHQAGFITAEAIRSSSDPSRIVKLAMVFELTWSGHEFLETVRPAQRWTKVKELAGKIGSHGAALLANLATALTEDEAKRRLSEMLTGS